MATKKIVKKSAKKLVTGYYAIGGSKSAKTAAGAVRVERQANGKFVINGTPQDKLVNQYPGVKIRSVNIQPDNLSKKEISEIVRLMKVA